MMRMPYSQRYSRRSRAGDARNIPAPDPPKQEMDHEQVYGASDD